MSRRSLTRALVAGAVLLGAAAACTYTVPRNALGGWERSDDACVNGVDDDGDGFVDCRDNDCQVYSGVCNQIIPLGDPDPEPEDALLDCRRSSASSEDVNRCRAAGALRIARCTDGVDNDQNGKFDCGDDACRGIPEVNCEREVGTAACTDGVDNDGNGFIDCAGDFACSRDRFTVCPRSPSSSASGGTSSPSPDENSVALCSNGVDDDRDGYTDCADYSCTDAAKGASPEAVKFCADTVESSFARCTDGIDNDGNGYADCADNACRRAKDPAVLAACQEDAGGDGNARCSDGLDDDVDGFVDCEDDDCVRNCAITVCPHPAGACP
jgi:hypothetical protein